MRRTRLFRAEVRLQCVYLFKRAIALRADDDNNNNEIRDSSSVQAYRRQQ